jgi:hypothetical protein
VHTQLHSLVRQALRYLSCVLVFFVEHLLSWESVTSGGILGGTSSNGFFSSEKMWNKMLAWHFVHRQSVVVYQTKERRNIQPWEQRLATDCNASHLYAVFYENSSSPGQRAFWSHKRNVCRTHQYAIPMFLSVIVRFSFIDTVGRKDEALSSFVEILKGASGIASGTTKLCYRYLCSSRQQPNLHN